MLVCWALWTHHSSILFIAFFCSLHLFCLFIYPFNICLSLISMCMLSYVWLFRDPMDYSLKLLCLWNFLKEKTGVGCHFLLQGIFPTQRSNLCLLLGRQIFYRWASWKAPKETRATQKLPLIEYSKKQESAIKSGKKKTNVCILIFCVNLTGP